MQADSRGDVRQAVRVLDSVLAGPHADDDPGRAGREVLAYRAELAMVLHDPETAAELLARIGGRDAPDWPPAFRDATLFKLAAVF